MGMPIWTLLTAANRSSLVSYDRAVPPAIALWPCAPEVALRAPLVMAVRMMLERTVAKGGLKLTPGGFLCRADTMPLFEAIDWPIWSKARHVAVTKVINEREVTPIHLARITAMKAGLLRRRGKLLTATKAGKDLLQADRAGDLLVRLIEASFWKVRQEDFDGVPFAPWPQDHAGVALWSAGAVTRGWRDAEELLPICAMPFMPIAGMAEDYPKFAFFLRISRPAVWLGLLDYEERSEPGERWPVKKDFVRKTELFDSALRFEVELAEAPNVIH